MDRRTSEVRIARRAGVAGLVCIGLLGGLTLVGCSNRKKDAGYRGQSDADARAQVPAPSVAPAPRETTPAPESPARPTPSVQLSPPAVGIAELIALLRNKKVLRTLVPPPENTEDSGTAPVTFDIFADLVPGFLQTVHDDETREFEGTNVDGPVRGVTVTFAPARGGGWRFHSAAIRIHASDPSRTFAEVRGRATAILRKPKWMDLGGLGRTAWNLGERWELTVAVLQGGEIQLRSGLPARN